LANGSFQTVIDEVDQINKADVTRLVLCGGKVYYDLLEKRRELGLNNIAIVRIEQLYPYPEQRIAEVLAQYPNIQELVWAQEEPKNQGAWLFIVPRLYEDVLKSVNKFVLAMQVVKLLPHLLVVHHICMQNNKLSSSMTHLRLKLNNQEILNNGNRN
jgi:2-oxoglutarate dehydrogenase complex dehydrogenase (E1) component-like enzyme